LLVSNTGMTVNLLAVQMKKYPLHYEVDIFNYICV